MSDIMEGQRFGKWTDGPENCRWATTSQQNKNRRPFKRKDA